MRQIFSVFLALLFFLAPVRAAERDASAHVVPRAELQQRLNFEQAQREQNIRDLQRLFSHDEVRTALRSAGVDPVEVTEAVPELDDETLAELAAKARSLEGDVSGGILSGLILLLLLAIVLAVIFIVYLD